MEEGELFSAQSVAFAKCVRAQLGYDWYASDNWDSLPAESHMFSELGPWTTEMADAFGFVSPAPRGYLSANGIVAKPKNNDEIDAAAARYAHTPEEANEATETCGGPEKYPESRPFDVAELGVWNGPWIEEFNSSWSETQRDERTQAVIDELKVCYTEKGLAISAPNSPDAVGADGRLPIVIEGASTQIIDEAQIEMANKVVACKQETSAIQRITEIWAEKQAPIVEEYSQELTDLRSRIDTSVESATSYIAANQDLLMQIPEQEW